MKKMRKVLVALVCALLISATAFSALGDISILEVTVKGARVRSGPGNYEILGSLKKGTRVIYGNKKTKAYVRVVSETGKEGWIFRDHVKLVGTVDEDSVRVTTKACMLYTNLKKKRGKKLKANTAVSMVYNDGEWAYVITLSGKEGYVSMANLK